MRSPRIGKHTKQALCSPASDLEFPAVGDSGEPDQSPVLSLTEKTRITVQGILEFGEQSTREETFYRVSSGNLQRAHSESLHSNLWPREKTLLCTGGEPQANITLNNSES